MTKDLEKKVEYVDVDNLRFDSKNPRLPKNNKLKTERDIIEWMLNDATIIELMGSIGEVGFFPGEPLLVAGPDDDQKYDVVEGNRRLCALKLLKNPELAPVRRKAVQAVFDDAKYHPDKVPVLKYENRSEILDYLGFRHITGIKQWDSLAKARYLDQLREGLLGPDDINKFRQLAKTIGSRSDYVMRLLTGYKVYESIADQDFFNLKNVNDDTVDFSILTTSLNYSNISDYLGLESSSDFELKGLKKENLEKLTSWFYEPVAAGGKTRLGESRNLKYLNKVIVNDAALAAFEEGRNLRESAQLTESPDQIFKTSIREAREKLLTAREYSHLTITSSDTDLENLKEIQKLANQLALSVDDQLSKVKSH